MHQNSLFTETPDGMIPKDPPASHADDPETSKIAEQQHTESGKRHRNADLVLKLVRENPNCTANEIWELANDFEKHRLRDFYEVRRRLNDLHKSTPPLVKVSGQRKCSSQKTLMQTWSEA